MALTQWAAQSLTVNLLSTWWTQSAVAARHKRNIRVCRCYEANLAAVNCWASFSICSGRRCAAIGTWQIFWTVQWWISWLRSTQRRHCCNEAFPGESFIRAPLLPSRVLFPIRTDYFWYFQSRIFHVCICIFDQAYFLHSCMYNCTVPHCCQLLLVFSPVLLASRPLALVLCKFCTLSAQNIRCVFSSVHRDALYLLAFFYCCFSEIDASQI